MTAALDTFPDLTRSDAAIAVASTWRVGEPEQQQTAAEAITAAWRDRPWPSPGLLCYSVFGSVNGPDLLHYSLWNGPDTAPTREAMQDRWTQVSAEMPGIERLGEHEYWRYRSTQRKPRRRRPGCYVAVRAEFAVPDARRRVDGVFDPTGLEPRPADGLIGAHSHLSTDGRHLLNLAEWTDDLAHRGPLDAPDGRVHGATALLPGLTRLSYERFRLLRHLDH